jgi:hypothetical protein
MPLFEHLFLYKWNIIDSHYTVSYDEAGVYECRNRGHLIIQTVHILQLESAVTDSLHRESVFQGHSSPSFK